MVKNKMISTNNKSIILVCTHKPFYMFNDDVLTPIHLGKKISKLNLGYLGDDEGTNISERNPNYCELTALYWAWKNIDDYKFIGFCHYRRFFDFTNKSEGFVINDIDLKEKREEFIFDAKSMNGIDIILPTPYVHDTTIWKQYSIAHNEKDLIILRDVINEKHIDYLTSFDEVMSGNELYSYNMFITSSQVFKSYVTWLFDILFEVEKRVQISQDDYQKRIFGFISERLIGVYVKKNNLKLKTYPIAFINESKKYSDNVFSNLELLTTNTTFIQLFKVIMFKLYRVLILLFKAFKRTA